MINAVIFEDEPILAYDLQLALEESGVAVVGVYSSGRSGLVEALKCKPQVAFIDLMLADGPTGAEVAIQLAARGCRIVVLSSTREINAKLCSIAHTFVSKPVPDHLIRSLLPAAKASRWTEIA